MACALRGFVRELFKQCNVDLGRLRDATFAVHPSDRWVIDRVIDVLLLRDEQLAASRRVLRDEGDMLSATLPHIWMRLLADPSVAPGTLIPSIAFGPGLTLWGLLLEKR
jgi:predicted naringenin-chalcone synthase